jgi:TonB family protein
MGSFFHGLSMIFPRLLDHTVEITVLICLILFVKFVVSKKWPPWWHYSLWLLLLVRMLVPLEFENRLNVFNFVPTVQTHQVSELISSPSPETEMPAPPMVLEPHVVKDELRFAVTKSIPVIWFTGALVLGICIIFETLSFWRNVRRRPKVTDPAILALLSECKRRMRIRRNIDIIVTDNVRCPALFGYFRPRLLLPEGVFEKLSDRELSYAFMHELGHLKRHDIGVSWVVSFLQVIHWFNPVVWLAFYQMRVDQESACDSAVLSRMNPRQSADYAKAIVGFLEKFCHNCQLPALAGVLENRSQMKKRIAKIVQYRKTSLKLSFTAFILFVSAGFLLFTLTGVAAVKTEAPPGMEMASFEISGHIPESSSGGAQFIPDGFHGDAPGVVTGAAQSPPMVSLPGAFPVNALDVPMATPQHETPGTSEVVLDGGNTVVAVEAGPEKPRVTLADTSVSEPLKPTASDQIAEPGPGASENPVKARSTEPVSIEEGAVTASGEALTPETPAQTFQVAGDKGIGHPAENNAAPQGSASQVHSMDLFQAGLENNAPRQYDPLVDEKKRPDGVVLAAAIEMMEKDSGDMGREISSAASMAAKQELSGPPGAFRAVEVDTPPRLIKAHKPRYPYMAKRDDISGSITLQFVVTKEGNAVDTTVVQSDPKGVFDQAALRAIELYRFKPGIKDGKAVDVKVNLPIKFNLS